MTILEFCNAENKSLSTARANLKKHGIGFDRHRAITDAERDIIRGAKPAEAPRKKQTQTRAKTIASAAQELRADVESYAHDFTRNVAQELAQVTREVDAQDAPRKERRLKMLRRRQRVNAARAWSFDILMGGIAVGHAALIWYDCSRLWHTPGTIGGGLSFGMVLGALVIATDRKKMETSENALYFVFLVDFLAGFAHYAVFSKDTTLDWWATAIFSAFICLCSFVALYLFRNSKNTWQ
jgi:uncharacterized DUF497 family protein